MNVSVIICSVNRPAILHDTVMSISGQTLKPAEILIVSPSQQHVLQETLNIPAVRFATGPLGLPAQRNVGLDQLNPECDLIAFFDDDIELCVTYLEEMAGLFSDHQEVLMASGMLLHDGGRGTIVTREQAKSLCQGYEKNIAKVTAGSQFTSSSSAYGCNMLVRHSAANSIRFDDGLPLYAWLEDRDYSHRLTKLKHSPVEFRGAVAVHLGSRSGRIGGVRMGFSEIINPVYLWAKNRTFSIPYIVVQYWLRCLAGNILGVLKGDSEYDRRGLLKGNFLGFLHLLSGRCDPAHITKLTPNNSSSINKENTTHSEVITSTAS